MEQILIIIEFLKNQIDFLHHHILFHYILK